MNLGELLYDAFTYAPFLRKLVVLIIVYVFLNMSIGIISRMLLRKSKGKKRISNIKIFTRFLRYTLVTLILIIALFTFTNSWTGLGLSLGLLSAGLGFALQRPITGLAAWIMVITRRPFDIGDRIIIGEHKGDVTDITISHIYLDEIDGVIPTDENSGRTVMIPNYQLFEQSIINYTMHDKFVLDEVITSITYESNMDTAIKLILVAAKKVTKSLGNKKDPYIRLFFADSAVNVHVRYFVPADQRQVISSKITKEIFDQHLKVKKVDIAYPHMELIMKKG